MKYIEEIFVRSSINIILTEPGKFVPVDYGTGCIVEYRERNFLLSVSHVTKKGLDIYIEPNQPNDGKTSPIIPVTGILSYTYLNFDDTTPEKLLEHIEKGGIAIDFSFAEIKTQIDILQNDIKFPSFTISGGSKIFPKLEYAADPNQSGIYGFFGYINQDMNGIYLQRRPEFKTPLKFHKHDREFLVFKAKKQIKDREEYAGLSGAPIFDFNGNLTALACAVKVRTNMVYGFPLTFGRHLIDIAIDTNQI